MKTLDEVISTMEYEQAYNAGEARDYDADALHYLKEYRRVRSQPDNCCIDDYDKPMWNPKDHWE